MRRPAIAYGALLAWMGVIFRASATPDLKAVPLAQRIGALPAMLGPGATDVLETLLRKGAHMVSFGILALLALAALGSGWPRLDRRHHGLAAFIFAVCYAASDEWHQRFVPTRDGKLTDVLIDAAGAALALLVAQAWRRRRLVQMDQAPH